MNQIGIIGLAVMGRSLALNMADHGYKVAGYNRSYEVTKQMVEKNPHKNFTPYETLEEFVKSLEKPRKVMLMVKAGKAVDAVIEQLLPLLENGDIIMDGGNSFFEDTIRREAYVKRQGLHYFGIGISGGEEGARKGPSIMPGGDREAYEEIRSILENIAAKSEDGTPCCTYIGENGAGHYVKMVHNGIEYADMQLIAEAYLVLKHIGKFNNQEVGNIFEEYQKGELSSFLIRITSEIFQEMDDMSTQSLVDMIKDSAQQKGTGRWTNMEALKQGIDVSMIAAAGNARLMSNKETRKTAGTKKAGKRTDNRKEIRKENSLPILMFTSKNDSASKVRGLRAGADDYLTKPFDMDELIARIISLIRRYTRFNQTDGMTQQLEFDGLKIDLENRSIITENGTFELPPKEFDLLLYCAKHQGKILTKQQIYEEVWGEEYVYDDSNIMAIISRLRKKLEVNPGNPKYIQTIKGIGYRFSKEV